jgi:hypothetical protein
MQNILLFRLIKNFIEDENNELEGLEKKKSNKENEFKKKQQNLCINFISSFSLDILLFKKG